MSQFSIGIYSPTLDQELEHVVVNAEFPLGRYTEDEQLANAWAKETADLANSDPNSGATDWQPRIWPRRPESYNQWIQR